MEQHIQARGQDELLPAMQYNPEVTANYLEHVRLVRFRAAAGGEGVCATSAPALLGGRRAESAHQ